MSREPESGRRAEFHQLWDPFIGREASEFRYLGWKLRSYMFLNSIAIAILAITAGMVSAEPAHTILFALAGVTGAVQLAGIGWWFRLQNRQYAAASWHLSVPVTARNFPPPNRASFSKWCQRNGIVSESPPETSTEYSLPPHPSET